MKGKIVSWRSDRQFGFIQCDELKRRVFFHVSEFRSDVPQINHLVEFDLAADLKGHPQKAINVTTISSLCLINAGADALKAGL
jgi:cold shock CspA family protein